MHPVLGLKKSILGSHITCILIQHQQLIPRLTKFMHPVLPHTLHAYIPSSWFLGSWHIVLGLYISILGSQNTCITHPSALGLWQSFLGSGYTFSRSLLSACKISHLLSANVFLPSQYTKQNISSVSQQSINNSCPSNITHTLQNTHTKTSKTHTRTNSNTKHNFHQISTFNLVCFF